MAYPAIIVGVHASPQATHNTFTVLIDATFCSACAESSGLVAKQPVVFQRSTIAYLMKTPTIARHPVAHEKDPPPIRIQTL